MQKLDVYYKLIFQHVSGIIMPIFRRSKTPLLHLVYCSGSAGCGWYWLWGTPEDGHNDARNIVLTPYKTAPHNRYQPHPAEPEQYTKYSNGVFDLPKMGIIMPETC